MIDQHIFQLIYPSIIDRKVNGLISGSTFQFIDLQINERSIFPLIYYENQLITDFSSRL